MNRAIWEAAELLPSVRRFLGSVVQDLKAGKSVVVLLPPGIPADYVWLHLKTELHESDLSCEVIDASLAAPRQYPSTAIELLRAVVGDEVPSRMQLREAIALRSCPEVIAILGCSSAGHQTRSRLLNTIVKWPEETAPALLASRLTDSRALCVIDSAETLLPCLPPTGPRMAVRWWWGFPSALEVRLLSRELSPVNSTDAAWLECLVSGLAPGDLALADLIMSSCPRDPGEMRELLAASAVQQGIAGQMTCTTRISSQDVRMEPPVALRKDWAAGRVLGSPEYGLELHPSLLALTGNREGLAQRVWRGQAQMILPVVDSIRMAASQYAIQRHGEKWYEAVGILPQDLDQRERLLGNPLDAELGYLALALRQLRGGPERFDWIHRVDTAREVRNSLAHYTMVGFPQFKTFLASASTLGKSLTDGSVR